MRVLPAIDLLAGQAVRLRQGRYDDVTVYSDDPLAVARRFRADTDALHVVDLEGARSGTAAQEPLLRALVEAHAGGHVQVGGGVRTREALERYLRLGATRVVLGTAAVRDPALVEALAVLHPGKVVIAVDAKDGFVAIEGWTETSRLSAAEVVRSFGRSPLAAVLYTDVARDGMHAGPNLEATAALAALSPLPVIASGGVATVAHLAALARIANVEGAVVGRALYDGSLTLADAIHAARG